MDIKILQFTVTIALLCRLGFSAAPLDVARKVAEKINENKLTFYQYEYGGAIIFDSLLSHDHMLNTSYTPSIYSWMDGQLNNTESVPYCVINHKFFPNADALGDIVGLFPINYLTRLTKTNYSNTNRTGSFQRRRNNYGEAKFDKSLYWKLINISVNDFVLGWPEVLPDGTFARREHGNWDQPAKGPSFVWADDEFMGLTLLARLSAVQDNKTLTGFVAYQTLRFSQYLNDPQDNLHYHGYNHDNGEHACCKWGRGNGWSLMAHMEILHALDSQGMRSSELRAQVLTRFRDHVTAMIKVQDVDGRWHQVLDHKETYLETSVTSMTLYALTRGVIQGWLTAQPSIHEAIMRAWEGLQRAIDDDGTVHGICRGTGIQNTVDEYQQRSTEYLNSSPGLGSVLYALSYLHEYLSL